MSIAAVLTALQARHALIADVQTAPAYAPDTMPAGNLPCILADALEGATQWRAHAGNVAVEERTYLVRVLVAPLGLGTPEQQRARTVALLDALLASYRAEPAVGSSATVQIDKPGGVRDSGPRPFGPNGPVAFGAESYYGAEIRLVIEERYG